jgi:hypothetical protein
MAQVEMMVTPTVPGAQPDGVRPHLDGRLAGETPERVQPDGDNRHVRHG